MQSLTTPQQLRDFDAILDRRGLAESTRYRYGREIDKAQTAGINLLDATAVAEYAAQLPTSRQKWLTSVLSLIADDLTQQAKSSATPENVFTMQAVVWRAEALKTAVSVQPSPTGERARTWLSHGEAHQLLTTLTEGSSGQKIRDRVVLGLLLGAGLRRAELAGLQWADIMPQGERTVINVTGKGSKRRIIPISEKLLHLLGRWEKETGRAGHVARSVNKAGSLGVSLSGQAILDIVAKYGRLLGKEELRPHDLRRTYARIGYDAGVDIGQISKLLGHASIATTQRYLGLEIDLKKTISDFIPF